jgi:hypothetical protein
MRLDHNRTGDQACLTHDHKVAEPAVLRVERSDAAVEARALDGYLGTTI